MLRNYMKKDTGGYQKMKLQFNIFTFIIEMSFNEIWNVIQIYSNFLELVQTKR